MTNDMCMAWFIRSRSTMRESLQAILIIGLVAAPMNAAGLVPEEAVKRFRVPDGFEVRIAAAEPLIRQPVSMSFDDRGRLWVLQYLQYPNPAGLTPIAVDQFLRTKYDRVPEPPPKGPKGADKLTVLFDRDEVGRFRQSKDFITGLNLASGFCIGNGGVYVAQPPYLLFYPDRDGDDVPDSDPKVVLTGFGTEDSHAYANSLQWGPDGWLYGAQGSTVTANIRGIEFQQGVWRYHPPTDRFELFAEGGGNIWGLDFDRNNQLIAGTNFGGYACMHVVQGGYYVKNWGKHGALHNPHSYGFFDHIACPNFKGGHVTCGGIVYRGGAFPKHFEDRYVACNLLSNAVNWFDLESRGTTFTSRQAGTLLATDDRHFRPVDLTIGPDGAIYVADWYDERANHVDPVDNWDKTTGRIYRVAPKGLPISSMPASTRGMDEVHTRAWSARMIGDWGPRPEPEYEPLQRLARDVSSVVRAQVAATCRRIPPKHTLHNLKTLIATTNEADDPFLPLLLWWAVEDLMTRDAKRADELFASAEFGESQIARTTLLERVARRLSADAAWDRVANLASRLRDPRDWPSVVRGLEHGTYGKQYDRVPEPLLPMLRKARSDLRESDWIPLAVRLGDAMAYEQLLKTVSERETAEIVPLIELLGELGRTDAVSILARRVREKNLATPIRSAAMVALSTIGGDEATTVIAEILPELSADLRAKAIAILASRPSSAKRLLDAVDGGRIAAKEVPLDILRRISAHKQDPLDALVAKHWGRVAPESRGEVLAHIRHLSARLSEAPGNIARGAVLFKQHCAICHTLHGDGGKVGPDLTTVDRRSREWLLTQTVDPSAIVRPEFVSYNALTRDGRLLQGLIAEQSPQAITLIDAKGDRTTLPRAKIESLEPARASLMPEKLLDTLSNTELRDLFAYLQSDRKS